MEQMMISNEGLQYLLTECINEAERTELTKLICQGGDQDISQNKIICELCVRIGWMTASIAEAEDIVYFDKKNRIVTENDIIWMAEQALPDDLAELSSRDIDILLEMRPSLCPSMSIN